MRFDFIRQQRKAYPVTVLCHVMEVSRSGFYQYLRSEPKMISKEQFALESAAKELFRKSKKSYGTRRMSSGLKKRGFKVGRHQAGSLMRRLDLRVRSRKRFRVTTDSKHDLPIAPNVLNREFQVDVPDRAWASDITYIWTCQGWFYLAVVLDLFSRKVVGWSLQATMTANLVTEALAMAVGRRCPSPGLLHHSDRGSQYASSDYRDLLKKYGLIASMSRKGNCWDNAVVERFFRSLKTELTDHYIYATRAEARRDIIEYIEMFYNSDRLHSYLGYLSPAEFEEQYWKFQKAA
jgi:transposase InsO family protein